MVYSMMSILTSNVTNTINKVVTLPVRDIYTAVAAGVGCTCLWLLYKGRRLPRDQLSHRLVIITGCDSGIGYSTAIHCHNLGFVVLAFVLDSTSDGAVKLTEMKSMRLMVLQMDITKPHDVSEAVKFTIEMLEKSKTLALHAIFNNAGVMVFGELEWLTERMIEQQLQVNLAGPIRVSRMFAPLLRKYKSRLINVSSHCASLPLPGASVYAATKGGLQAWSDALRVEWAKYGISVISVMPGAFFQETNILARQSQHASEMKEALSAEAAEFYGNYFTKYHGYLSGLAGVRPPVVLECKRLYSMLDSVLMDCLPYHYYHNTPWRYSIYHNLASVAPIRLRDWLVTRFTAMPDFEP